MKRVVTFAAVAAALVGCQPRYDGLRIRILNGGGDVVGSEIEVVEGQALVIEVRPESSNPFEDYEDFNLVRLEALNESILFAAPADEVDRFVLVGARPGWTSVDVLIDGRHEDTLRVEVVRQEAP